MSRIEPMLTDDDVEGYLADPERWRYRALLMSDLLLGELLSHPERMAGLLINEE